MPELGLGALSLLLHPFGDLFVQPLPALFWPLQANPASGVLAFSEPLRVIAAAGVELSLIVAATIAVLTVAEVSLERTVRPVVLLGILAPLLLLFTPILTFDTVHRIVLPIVLHCVVVGTVESYRRGAPSGIMTAAGFATTAYLSVTIVYLL